MPKFLYKSEHFGDDWWEVLASDQFSAAEKIAERIYKDDPDYFEVRIEIKDKDGIVKIFDVYAAFHL